MTRAPEQQFRVYLYDRAIGILRRREKHSRFVFDEDYLADPQRSVLGLRFEENLFAKNRASMRLPVWFSNLLPEGQLRECIADASGVSAAREMDLLAYVGHDLPGAVRVLPADEPLPVDLDGPPSSRPGASEKASSLWRFSLAGVGLKFSMLAQGERFTVPAVGEGGDWIVKVPHPTFPEIPASELAMMTLAGAAGIEVPQIKLVHREQIESLPNNVWPRNEVFAYAVRRFDRGDRRELIHIEDLAQVRGFYPEAKYVGSFETVGALIYRGRDVEALRGFARRLAFNVLIGNGDAHLKNWSLIYRDPRVPTLAPVYDLLSTAVYKPESSGPEDLGLQFGRSKRFRDVRLSHFGALDKRLGAQADLEDVVAGFVKRVVVEWPAVADLVPRPVRESIRSMLMMRALVLGG